MVSMALRCEDLRLHCQCIDGTLLAANRGLEEPIPYHKVTTLQRFIELVDELTTQSPS